MESPLSLATAQNGAVTIREPISKRIRFEVFKRDSFKCQYCGANAPDVLLHIDHIRPVADGGTGEISNLITACEGCNLGKGARLLSENSAVEKSRRQLDILQERREQLELMMEWQRSLADLADDTIDSVASFWTELTDYRLNPLGKSRLSKVVNKFGVAETMTAMRIAADRYVAVDTHGKNSHDSVELAISKIGGICELTRRSANKPYLKDLYYFRNVLAKRLRYCPPWEALSILETAFLDNVPLDTLREIVLQSKNWTAFVDRVLEARGK